MVNENKITVYKKKAIRNMTDKLFMDVKDVTKILEVSDGKAYEIIRMLNEELKQ